MANVNLIDTLRWWGCKDDPAPLLEAVVAAGGIGTWAVAAVDDDPFCWEDLDPEVVADAACFVLGCAAAAGEIDAAIVGALLVQWQTERPEPEA